jgi:uncharacterized protein (TIGR02117 family)
MSKLRLILRILKRTLLLVVGGVALYGGLALLLPRIPLHADWRPPDAGVTLFIESNGVHTDFVVPIRTAAVDWSQHLPYEWFERADATFEYVSFGWGDRGFYLETPTWSDLKFTTAFKAAFFLDTAALHVTYYRWPPATTPHCRELRISADQYRQLVDYILTTFVSDANGRFEPIDHPGFTSHDRFFAAHGTYSLFHTCNGWTGAGLDAIGVRTGLWTPFAGDVLRHLGPP